MKKFKAVVSIITITILIATIFSITRNKIIDEKIEKAESIINNMQIVKSCVIFIKEHIANVYIESKLPFYSTIWDEKEEIFFGYNEGTNHNEYYVKSIIYGMKIPGVWDVEIITK